MSSDIDAGKSGGRSGSATRAKPAALTSATPATKKVAAPRAARAPATRAAGAAATTKAAKAAKTTKAPKTAKATKAGDAPKALKKTAAAKTASQPLTKGADKSAPGASAASGSMWAGLTEEQRRCYVEVAAYYIAERRGFNGDSQVEDWVQAETEIERLLQQGVLHP